MSFSKPQSKRGAPVSKRRNVLISVHQCHATNFRTGKKTVELRRRRVHLVPGTTVWIYSKVPKGKVDLSGTVDHVIKAAPEVLWRRFGGRCGVSRSEFKKYFGESTIGSAIVLREIRQLAPSIDLKAVRQVSSRFQPPQFLKFLPDNSPELKLFRESKRTPPPALQMFASLHNG
jgi:predicted transcriptional regulator